MYVCIIAWFCSGDKLVYIVPPAIPRAAVTANSTLASLRRYWPDSRPRHCSRAHGPIYQCCLKITLLYKYQADGLTADWLVDITQYIPEKLRLLERDSADDRWPGRGRHWNFDPLQCLGPRPEILDRYISLSCLRWLQTTCHERLAYFHWPQCVTWLITWWVTWSRWPDAGCHIGKFSLWTTLLRFSRSAQISLFSNFTKLGQLFFDNIFFGLTS